jgi:hypothetical protein
VSSIVNLFGELGRTALRIAASRYEAKGGMIDVVEFSSDDDLS